MRRSYCLNSYNPLFSLIFQVHIRIAAVDDSVPQLVTNRPVTSLRKIADSDDLGFTLSSSNLKVTDKDTASNNIMYWVIDKPAVGQLLKGGQPANMWTQGEFRCTKKICSL